MQPSKCFKLKFFFVWMIYVFIFTLLFYFMGNSNNKIKSMASVSTSILTLVPTITSQRKHNILPNKQTNNALSRVAKKLFLSTHVEDTNDIYLSVRVTHARWRWRHSLLTSVYHLQQQYDATNDHTSGGGLTTSQGQSPNSCQTSTRDLRPARPLWNGR